MLPMLQTLRVQNLAIVEDIWVGFQPGLNVITGETGAGKSILVGALGLVLGERADRTLIRAGADKCSVEAVFHFDDAAAVNRVLAELEMPPCDDGQLIIRRTITAGSSRNTVNDTSTTLQGLHRIGDLLVDMHGPHDHQSLLNPDFQLDLLDAFGELAHSRAGYETHYREWQELARKRTALDSDEASVREQIDFLGFQVKEIEDAGLADADEDTAVEREHTTVANAGRILELAEGVCRALSEDDASVVNSMAVACRALDELSGLHDGAGEWRQESESISIQVQELARTVRQAAESIDCDPARLQWLEDRLALLHKLKRKYGGTLAGVLRHHEEAAQRLHDLETRDEQLARLDAEIEKARRAVMSAGKTLSGRRSESAGRLAAEITRQLRDLGFKHGGFEVGLAQGDPRAAGLDSIEFGFAPNVGEPMRALRAIASSGEISRVMLAVKSVLARHDRIPVLVFDEIDANVGGEMGHAVGTKMDAVAEHHQVLCITHLPQVAVHGTTHFVVKKFVRDKRTRTDITPVDGDARVEEVARMLGGKDLTSVTLQHAAEMLSRDALPPRDQVS